MDRQPQPARPRALLAAAALALALAPAAAFAQGMTLTDHVLDGCGGWMTNSQITCIAVLGQPQPVGQHLTPGHAHRGGFVGRLGFFPLLDTDGDGLVDEDDTDDDGDLLGDALELAGTAFSPTMPTDPMAFDSDGDGMGDSSERNQGTNPMDTTQSLEITGGSYDPAVGWFIIRFRCRGNGQAYRLNRFDGPGGDLVSSQVLNVSGGSPPWYFTETATIDLQHLPQCVYGLEPIP